MFGSAGWPEMQPCWSGLSDFLIVLCCVCGSAADAGGSGGYGWVRLSPLWRFDWVSACLACGNFVSDHISLLFLGRPAGRGCSLVGVGRHIFVFFVLRYVCGSAADAGGLVATVSPAVCSEDP